MLLEDMTTKESGRGELYWRDGRHWGPVDYALSPTANTIRGRFRRIGVADPIAPFLEIDRAILRLTDGRWWVCVVQPDGAVVAGSPTGPDGFHAEQPLLS
jgi:hypothetical protein